MSRIALVTGSNKGMGNTLVRLLATQNPTWTVYLTSRDVKRGEEATKALGLPNVKFHQLDILDAASIEKLAADIKAAEGGLDVLVNNAGVMYPYGSNAPLKEEAEVSMATNFTALVAVTKAMVPLLRDGARIVNVTSRSSNQCYFSLSEEMKARVLGFTKRDEVIAWAKEYVEHAAAGTSVEKGYGTTPYGASKLASTLITPIMQSILTEMGKNVVVNCCCPNFINTEMTGGKGAKSPEFGADVMIYLATLPEGTDIKGKFVAEREVITVQSSWRLDPVEGIVKA